MRQSLRRLWRRLQRVRTGSNDNYSTQFNTPIRLIGSDWFANERLVELPFVHRHLELDGRGKRALEFGCTLSELALQLASLGYEVVGLDLRPYPFTHPNLTVRIGNLLSMDDEQGFDVITAVSVIEHIGLGAYGEERKSEDLIRVVQKLCSMLRPGGILIVTTPVGMPWQDNFFRSFTAQELLSLFNGKGLSLVEQKYYRRTAFKHWTPCTVSEIAGVANDRPSRGPTGVNGVGCFVWRRDIT